MKIPAKVRKNIQGLCQNNVAVVKFIFRWAFTIYEKYFCVKQCVLLPLLHKLNSNNVHL